MGTAPDAAMLDDNGAIAPEHFPAWLDRLHAAGWSWVRVARELGANDRDVRGWRTGEHVPSRTVRRLAWRALVAPMEAEVMRTLRGAPAPLQPASRQAQGMPTEQDIEAVADEAGMDPDALRAAIERQQKGGT